MHKIISVGPRKATETGALDHHAAVCSCGYVMGTTLGRSVATRDGNAHVAFMSRKGADSQTR